jgi:hypothetical protein
MAVRTFRDIEKVWSNVEGIKKLSDRVVGFGPFGIGLDGLLTWVPGVGLVYTIGAAGMLFVNAFRARASAGTMARMGAYLAFDALTTEAFLIGSAVDFFFPGHLMAAKALQKEIETTHWVEASEREARASGDHARHVAAMKAERKRRLVYLAD